MAVHSRHHSSAQSPSQLYTVAITAPHSGHHNSTQQSSQFCTAVITALHCRHYSSTQPPAQFCTATITALNTKRFALLRFSVRVVGEVMCTSARTLHACCIVLSPEPSTMTGCEHLRDIQVEFSPKQKHPKHLRKRIERRKVLHNN